jgi:RNA polymerase sigma factor (sigma-70 family)
MATLKSTESDRELVIRARAGDRGAVGDLYTRFWAAARASAYSIVKDFAAAEDATAEAMRLALMALHTLRDPDRFAPWLRRIVLRVARRHTTQPARAAESIEDAVRSDELDPSKSVERRQMAVLVCQAVERLPRAEREAIVLYYFEGYTSDEAARFVGIPVGSFRRRLHDGRLRLRTLLTRRLNEGSDDPRTVKLRDRVATLLAARASHDEWYDVLRDLLLSRPVPYPLLATLISGAFPSAPSAGGTVAAQWLARPRGSLFDDASAVGEAARALRAALSDCQEWVVDSVKILQTFPNVFRRAEDGRTVGLDPDLMPPGFSSGAPGRWVRVTRGLLFDAEGGEVIDPAELFLRSDSMAAFAQGLHPARLCDVLDVYWLESRPIELSEVEAWVVGLSHLVAPGSRAHCSPQPGLRYRSALRMTFVGDPRPAAIGGVLAAWPGAPDGVNAVLMRLYVEPWAQVRGGEPVPSQYVSQKRAAGR